MQNHHYDIYLIHSKVKLYPFNFYYHLLTLILFSYFSLSHHLALPTIYYYEINLYRSYFYQQQMDELYFFEHLLLLFEYFLNYYLFYFNVCYAFVKNNQLYTNHLLMVHDFFSLHFYLYYYLYYYYYFVVFFLLNWWYFNYSIIFHHFRLSIYLNNNFINRFPFINN